MVFDQLELEQKASKLPLLRYRRPQWAPFFNAAHVFAVKSRTLKGVGDPSTGGIEAVAGNIAADMNINEYDIDYVGPNAKGGFQEYIQNQNKPKPVNVVTDLDGNVVDVDELKAQNAALQAALQAQQAGVDNGSEAPAEQKGAKK